MAYPRSHNQLHGLFSESCQVMFPPLLLWCPCGHGFFLLPPRTSQGDCIDLITRLLTLWSDLTLMWPGGRGGGLPGPCELTPDPRAEPRLAQNLSLSRTPQKPWTFPNPEKIPW